MEKILNSMSKAGSVLVFIATIVGPILSLLPLLHSENLKFVCCIVVISVIFIAIVVFVEYLFIYDRQFKYINKQIQMIKAAKESIYIIMRSLTNEESKGRNLCKKFDEELERAVKRKVKVKIITSEVPELDRFVGATQIYCRGIPIGFLEGIETTDCRYIVVDERMIAFSQEELYEEGLSKKCQYIISKDLGKIMVNSFENLWEKVKPYSKYMPKYKLEQEDNTVVSQHKGLEINKS